MNFNLRYYQLWRSLPPIGYKATNGRPTAAAPHGDWHHSDRHAATELTNGLMRAFLGLLVTFLVWVGAFTSSHAAAAEYGAIAVVPQQGVKYYGFGEGSSQAKAQNSALRKCGHSRCTVVENFRRGQCAIMAIGRRQVFWNSAVPASIQRERARLLNHCARIDSNCRIILQQCQK